MPFTSTALALKNPENKKIGGSVTYQILLVSKFKSVGVGRPSLMWPIPYWVPADENKFSIPSSWFLSVCQNSMTAGNHALFFGVTGDEHEDFVSGIFELFLQSSI